MQTLQYLFCAYTMSFDHMKLFTADLKNGLIFNNKCLTWIFKNCTLTPCALDPSIRKDNVS